MLFEHTALSNLKDVKVGSFKVIDFCRLEPIP